VQEYVEQIRNPNVEIRNTFDFYIGMIRLKHWGFGFLSCFGILDSDFEFREHYVYTI